MSAWIDFRKQRPEGGQLVDFWYFWDPKHPGRKVGVVDWPKDGNVFTVGGHWFYKNGSSFKVGFWRDAPAPPTPEEIERAMEKER